MKVKSKNVNKKDNNKKDIKVPKTKKQKLKLKHRNLMIIIAVLLLILLVILLIVPKDDKQEKVDKKEEPKNEVKEKLSVYDEESKSRVYAVMIPNDGEAKKRQYGIQDAYMTYEITVEGGITRLMALYKDVNVEKIGPVRSSRHYYLDYALESDAIYVHFGWSPQAESDISSLGVNNLNGIYNPSNMFNRDSNYNSPNNAFTSTDKIKKAAEDKGYSLTSDNYEVLKYAKNVDFKDDETLKDANNVKVNYSGGAYVEYVYDKENDNYLRYNNKNKHIDNLTDKQVTVTNIIVIKMDTVSISGDDKGRQNLDNIGSGKGIYITGGKSIEITWSKKSRTSKTVYKNSKGEELKIKDGNTFIQIQPTSRDTVIE